MNIKNKSSKPQKAVLIFLVAICTIFLMGTLSFSTINAQDKVNPGDLPNVCLVPNMHPASCGWLVNFSVERNYCANSYFAHLDRINEDPKYNFAISEVNNMIAMLNFQPERFGELKKRISEGRAEAVNAMFLELTPNLSGGEAIVRMGVNGINWQKEMLGVKPRFNWMIDVTGFHEQLAQITAGLGMEAQVHCRHNISGSPLYMAESPDGTKVLTISPGHYSNNDWRKLFTTASALKAADIKEFASKVASVSSGTPDGAKPGALGQNQYSYKNKFPHQLPYLALVGSGDYSLPPDYNGYPAEFIGSWEELFPGSNLRFSTLGDYMDIIEPELSSVVDMLPVVKKGWGYSWDAFWIENPKVKSLYRSSEHALQGAEMLATIASLKGPYIYPAQDLYQAWLQLHLNTDRNTLWGAAGGMVFEDEKSWDALDRFRWIDDFTTDVKEAILKKQEGDFLTWFNPVNREQAGPQYIDIPEGKKPQGYSCQKVEDKLLFMPELSPVGMGSFNLVDGNVDEAVVSSLPVVVENEFYTITIDPQSGEIRDLSLKRTNKKIISEGAVIYSEKDKNNSNIFHALPVRKDRVAFESTKGEAADIEYQKGGLAQIIKITTSLNRKNDVHQMITVYNEYPRIDFDVYLEDLPDRTVTFMDFVPAAEVMEESRGVPYGFTGETPEELAEREEGVHPVIRWSNYKLANGAGFALLDRGLPGREISNNRVSVMLNVASDYYMGLPGGMVSGKGKHYFRFALVAYEGEESENGVQQLAWEYNSPPFFETSGIKISDKSIISTSDNIIVQSLRRVNDELEIRFVESKGESGKAKLKIDLPVKDARLTNFLGEGDEKLSGRNNRYTIPVRPQQIVTVRFKTDIIVDKIKPLTDWSSLVPENKREYLKRYNKDAVGHPPRK